MLSSKSLFSYYLSRFKTYKRAYFSLLVFLFVFLVSNLAIFVANDKPIAVYFQKKWYFPIFVQYSESTFGGYFQTEANYSDPYVKELLKNAFVLHPLIPYSYDTIDRNLQSPAPSSPDSKHWLGTDEMGRDVLARLIYAYQTSINFGLLLCFFSTIIGVCVGALQGYYGGRVDLLGQRFVEVWNGVPLLFLIIIISSFIPPSFWWILGLVLAFSWMGIVGVVRAEFLRHRDADYIKIAKTLGVSDIRIIFTHLLPNAMVSTITYTPFIMVSGIAVLMSLDFLGFGMEVGSASLGELLEQGKNNLSSPHLAIVSFGASAFLLSILVFIGEGVRFALSEKKAQ